MLWVELIQWKLSQKEGLEVSDVVVLIDRQQGGKAHLQNGGIQLHAAFTLTFIVETLVQKQLLTPDVAQSVKTFIAENQTTAAVAGVTLTRAGHSLPASSFVDQSQGITCFQSVEKSCKWQFHLTRQWPTEWH